MTDHQPAVSPTAATTPEAPKMSKGERLFDLAVYGGVNGLGTFLITLPTTYWLMHGKGKGIGDATTKLLHESGISTPIARDIVKASALMQGGNLCVIPVKLLEDRKPEIVARLNTLLGEESQAEIIKKKPRQSWASLVPARIFMAWLPVFVSFRAVGAMFSNEHKLQWFEDKFAKHVICKPFNKPTHIAGEETKLFRYGKIAALDVFATAAATSLLYIGSHFLANVLYGKKKDVMQQANAPQQASEDNVSTPQTMENQLPSQPMDADRQVQKMSAKTYAGTISAQKSASGDSQLALSR